MSDKTNKERLQDNNIELQNIKTGIDNLPDAQNIEPIYGADIQYKVMNTKQKVSPDYASVSFFENYALISWYSSYSSYRIVRIEEDNTVTVIVPTTRSNGTGGSILSVKDNFIYYTVPTGSGYTSQIRVFRANLTTFEIDTDYTWNCSVSSYFYTEVFFVEENTLKLGNSDMKKVVIDPINKVKVAETNFDYYYKYNDNCWGESSSITNIKTNYSFTSSIGSINFMSILGNKIIINNSLYNIDYYMNLGSKIKDMTVTDNYISNSIIIGLNSDLYIMCSTDNTYNNKIGYLCKFDDELNKFEIIYQVKAPRLQRGNSRQGWQVSFLSETNEMCYFQVSNEKDLNRLLGYNVYGRDFYFYDNYEVSTDKVISGYKVYNDQLNGVTGTMPNNGELNYTPTTSQQTIPAGYTSGGTIGAVTSSIDSNIQAENIKNGVTILGVEGTYEGSSDFNAKMLTSIADTTADLSKYIVNIPALDTSNIRNMNNTFYGCSALAEVPLLNTSNVTTMNSTFKGCSLLTSVPLFITSNVTSMSNIFKNCTSLVDVPVFDTSALINMTNMFSSCPNLSNNSLNNILTMCINAAKITSNKTLKYIGLTEEQANICKTLSNYSAFIAAGWTTGY